MPRYAVNIDRLFADLPYLDRFEAAARAGFTGIELASPYDHSTKETQRELLRHDLEIATITAPPPNYSGGERGFAAVEGQEGRFQYDMRRSFRYVEVLKTSFLHVVSGNASGADAKARYIANLKWACAAAPKGLTLTIEPINSIVAPNFFLNSYELAADVIKAVGADNLGLQYDSYQAQMITGDALATYEKYSDLIKFVQIGDAPNRTEPGGGVLDFDALFKSIEASGYDGWISADYNVIKKTEDTLRWMVGT